MPGQPEPGSNNFLTFDMTALKVTEGPFPPVAPEPYPPSTVIRLTNPWRVEGSFTFAEAWAAWIVSIPVTWNFQLRVESLGPGTETVFGPASGTTVAGQLSYGPGIVGPVPTIDVAAGALAVGVYKLVGAITFTGAPPPGMAGYFEGPVIQVIA